MTPVSMADCIGLWRRTLLVEADGSRDTGTDVCWLQGITAFVDTRGFGGWLDQDDDVFVWNHLRSPGDGPPDVGRMSWDSGTLIEVGVHYDYTEHWHRDSTDVSPCWALALVGGDGDQALLLRVGERFGWLRHGVRTHLRMGSIDGSFWVVESDGGGAFRASVEGEDLIVDEDGSGNSRRWRVEHGEGNMNL
jgi:hypothetical protein